MAHIGDLSAINDPNRSKFNPMSQTFVDQAREIHRMTLDPNIGGSTYHPHTASIMPVYYPPDRSPSNPDVFVAGGATDPDTGERFATHHVLSAEQFTPKHVEANMMRVGLASHAEPGLTAGTWRVTNEEGEPEHPRAGQIDLDVSDLHPTEDSALAAATERGEESIFANQGARTIHTVHSPKHPDYRKP
jgi:hypothetical protein